MVRGGVDKFIEGDRQIGEWSVSSDSEGKIAEFRAEGGRGGRGRRRRGRAMAVAISVRIELSLKFCGVDIWLIVIEEGRKVPVMVFWYITRSFEFFTGWTKERKKEMK